MSFKSFLGGALKILFGGAVFLFAAFTSMGLFMIGYTVSAIVVFAIGMVGALYAEYHRGRQGQRVRGGGNTYR